MNIWTILHKLKMKNFTKEELLTIFELARVALSDAEIYDYIVDKLDIADEEAKALQEKLNKTLNP